MLKIFLYLFVIPVVVYASDSLDINRFFKRGDNNYYRTRIMYMLIIMVFSYLVVSFINDFLGVL